MRKIVEVIGGDGDLWFETTLKSGFENIYEIIPGDRNRDKGV